MANLLGFEYFFCTPNQRWHHALEIVHRALNAKEMFI
jgi:hypothetical protein